MKYSVIFIFVLVAFLSSCEKDNPVPDSNVIDTTILINRNLEYSFGYLGDEEGLQIIKNARHAEICEIIIREGERILNYVPENGYIGNDTVILQLYSGSDGTSPRTDSTTKILAIKVKNDAFFHKLIGEWRMTKVCGGYTGDCNDIEDETAKWVGFYYESHYRETVNTIITRETTFHVIDSISIDPYIAYEVQIGEDNNTKYLWFVGDTLYVEAGDLIEHFVAVPIDCKSCNGVY